MLSRILKALGPREALALVLLATSLGLPWSYYSMTGGAMNVIPGYYVPSICRTVYDYEGWASMECGPSFVGAPIFLPNGVTTTGALMGHEHPGRFGVALAAVLIVTAALRKSERLLALAGVVVLGFTVLTAGLGFHTAGSALAWLTAGMLFSSGIWKRMSERFPKGPGADA